MSSMLQQRVGDKASQNAIFIEETQDLGYCIDTLMLHSVRHLLVTNEHLQLTGVISIMDLLNTLHTKGSVDFLNLRVEEIMSKNVFSVNADDPVRDAILLLENLGLSGMPVMMDSNIVGYFTVKDAISYQLNGIWESIPDTKIALDDNNIGRMLREEDLITDDYTVWQVADRFLQSNRRHLAVNSGSTGKYLGLMNPSTLFTAMIPSFERKFQEGILQDTPISEFKLRYSTFTTNSTSLKSVRFDMGEKGLSCIPIISNQSVRKLVNEKDLVGYLSMNI